MRRFRSGLTRVLYDVALALAVLLLSLSLLEGLASLVLLGRDLSAGEAHPRDVYLRPDTLLGWSNVPNTYMPAAFGPNRSLTINSQGFRDSPNPGARAGNTLKIVCSGDSFTFGTGVDDSETWCAALAAKDSRLETVNLGHSGWGVDQAYLFYEREGRRLDHAVHVFAFVTDDLRRVALSKFIGYPKPRFRLQSGRLELTGVPVTRPSAVGLWYENHQRALNGLRFLQAGMRVIGRFRNEDHAMTEDEARAIVLSLFEKLYRHDREAGRITVFVLLGERSRLTPEEADVRQFMARELGRLGIPFVDVCGAFQRYATEALDSMFDPKWLHYSARGNRVVADEIYRNLDTLPGISQRLSGLHRN